MQTQLIIMRFFQKLLKQIFSLVAFLFCLKINFSQGCIYIIMRNSKRNRLKNLVGSRTGGIRFIINSFGFFHNSNYIFVQLRIQMKIQQSKNTTNLKSHQQKIIYQLILIFIFVKLKKKNMIQHTNHSLLDKREKLRNAIRQRENHIFQNKYRQKLIQHSKVQQFKNIIQNIPSRQSQLQFWLHQLNELLEEINTVEIDMKQILNIYQFIKNQNTIKALQLLTRLIQHLHVESIGFLLQANIVDFGLKILNEEKNELKIQMIISIFSHICGTCQEFRNFIFLSNGIQIAIKVSNKNKQKYNPVLCFFFRCFTSYQFKNQQASMLVPIITHFIHMLKQENSLIQLLEGLSNCLRWNKQWCHELFTQENYIKYYVQLMKKPLTGQQIYYTNKTLLGYALIVDNYFQYIQKYIVDIIDLNLNILSNQSPQYQKARQDIYFFIQQFFNVEKDISYKHLFIERGLLSLQGNLLKIQTESSVLEQLLLCIYHTLNFLKLEQNLSQSLIENGFIKNIVYILTINKFYTVNHLRIVLDIIQYLAQSPIICRHILNENILYELYQTQHNHDILEKLQCLIQVVEINDKKIDF